MIDFEEKETRYQVEEGEEGQDALVVVFAVAANIMKNIQPDEDVALVRSTAECRQTTEPQRL